MTRLCRAFLAASAIVLAPEQGRSNDPPAQKASPTVVKTADPKKVNGQDDLQKFDLKMLLENQEPAPVNGVTLRIQGKQNLIDDFDTIQIEWQIEYSGPRPPLAILRPSLTEIRNDATTELMIFAAGKSGETYAYGIRNPVDLFAVLGPLERGKKSFLKIPKHQSDGEQFVIDTAQVRRHLRKRKPDEFDPIKPPKMYMKLYYSTGDRGEAHNLDAWTGRLESNLLPLELSEW